MTLCVTNDATVSSGSAADGETIRAFSALFPYCWTCRQGLCNRYSLHHGCPDLMARLPMPCHHETTARCRKANVLERISMLQVDTVLDKGRIRCGYNMQARSIKAPVCPWKSRCSLPWAPGFQRMKMDLDKKQQLSHTSISRPDAAPHPYPHTPYQPWVVNID